jgi:hypothetical protein
MLAAAGVQLDSMFQVEEVSQQYLKQLALKYAGMELDSIFHVMMVIQYQGMDAVHFVKFKVDGHAQEATPPLQVSARK